MPAVLCSLPVGPWLLACCNWDVLSAFSVRSVSMLRRSVVSQALLLGIRRPVDLPSLLLAQWPTIVWILSKWHEPPNRRPMFICLLNNALASSISVQLYYEIIHYNSSSKPRLKVYLLQTPLLKTAGVKLPLWFFDLWTVSLRATRAANVAIFWLDLADFTIS